MAIANNVEEFIAKQRAAVAANPECGTSHYNLGVGLLGQRKFEEAERAFIEAVENSPSLAEAYVQLGGICLERGDLDGCLKYNQMATKARPGFSEGFGNIGFVELQRGNVDEAIKALEKATKFNFRYVQALTTLANAYLMKGRIDDSIETNLKVLDLQPEFSIAHNNLAIAYLENGEFGMAKDHCDKAVELGYDVEQKIIDDIEAHSKKQ